MNKTIYFGKDDKDKERLEGLLDMIGQSLSRQGKASVTVKGKVSHSAVIAHLIEKSGKELAQGESVKS